MCNCQTKNEDAVRAHFAEKENGKHQLSGQAAQENTAIARIGNRLTAVGFDSYVVKAFPIKKDGSLGKEKRLSMPFVHSYCPHCGEKFPTD